MNRVDVIIPVYKPGVELKKLMQMLCIQTVQPDKIIIVQTVPDDYAGELIDIRMSGKDNLPKVEVRAVNASDFDHGGTRNYGATFSDAKHILFMTQDAVPKNKYLIENLLLTFEDNYSQSTKKNAISYARQLPRKGAGIVESMTREFNYPAETKVKTIEDLGKMGIHTFFCSDVCAMYDHQIFDELGGFVNPTIFNEDMIMAANSMDAGFSVTYCAEAKVIHSHSYTNKQQFTRNFDLGVSHAMYPDVFSRVSSEKTGAGYAKKLCFKLIKNFMFIELFKFVIQCVCKLAGYRLGKAYKKLPKGLVKKLSLNRNFWVK